MCCPNCKALEQELSEALLQLDEAKEAAARATDLMMAGEALRDRMLFESILGTFTSPAKGTEGA